VTERGRGIGAEAGQAAVELALVLPLVVLMLLLVVEVAMVGRDQVLVVHAAREAARAASVGESDDEVRRAAIRAGPLDGDRLRLDVTRDAPSGGPVEVRVTYHRPTDLPLVGPLLPDLDLVAHAVMRHE
jgi:Flp pilus assembly protein TadG